LQKQLVSETVLLACLTAIVSVLVGAALGLVGSGRVLGPIRALALGASIATVFGVLMPEAVAAGGALVLLPFCFGLLVPGLFERFGSGLVRADGHAVALELSYAGLLVHQLGDGLAMGAFAGEAHEGHAHWEVLAAVFGHTVPIVAAVVIAFVAAQGRLAAAFRAAGLAIAAIGGIIVTTSPEASAALAAHHAWVSAVTAGLLLHVVLHGIDVAPPRTRGARLLELAAFAVGAVIPVAVGHEHHEAHPHGTGAEALTPRALAAAPALAIGIGVAALVSARRGAGFLARLDPLLPRVVPFALFGMVVLAAFSPDAGPIAWPSVVAAAACAIPAYLIDRGTAGLGALVRAAVVFAAAVGLSVGAGMTGVDPAILGAMAIFTLAAVLLRAALVFGVREVFGAILPLHDHAPGHAHEGHHH
jgi:hypothetical protein